MTWDLFYNGIRSYTSLLHILALKTHLSKGSAQHVVDECTQLNLCTLIAEGTAQ